MRTSDTPAAFSLIEITLSLAIIATVVLALIGILPVGIDASKRATNSTVIANILDSLHHRLQGEPLTGGEEGLSFSPALFTAEGVFLPPDAPAAELNRAVYRADVTLSDWQTRPANTSALRLVTIALAWPVNTRAGTVSPQTVVSYPVTTLTGTDWPEIARAYTPDPVFVPKIGF